MTELRSNQRDFISLMKKSEESEADGFAILSKRPDAHVYWEFLLVEGFFNPNKNKGPVPADQEGYVRIPYWFGLDYFETVARHAGETNDSTLASKIIDVIIAFSRAADEKQRENYHTWRKFAEAVALLPIHSINKPLVDEMKLWLSSSYDRSLVAGALGNRVLPRLIASGEDAIVQLALELLGFLTALRRSTDGESEAAYQRPDSEVESYWVKEILTKNLRAFASERPAETAALFRERVREVFRGSRSKSTWLYRPAIEHHSQNMTWQSAENYTVEALRDVILIWFESDVPAATDCAVTLFQSDAEIERRIAVHIADVMFTAIQHKLDDFITPSLFELSNLHETYNLLDHHYLQLSLEQRAEILRLIQDIHVDAVDDDAEKVNARIRRTWLAAISGKGSLVADQIYTDLLAVVGAPSEHPDFLSYHESFTGPGPSPFSKAELLQFVIDGALVDRLNAFVPKNEWRSPNKRALTDTLEDAVASNPAEFLSARRSMLKCNWAYRYAYLAGYLKLWNTNKTNERKFDWDAAWPALLDFVQRTLEDQSLWTEVIDADLDLSPNKNWLISTATDVVQGGTRDDTHAFDPKVLPTLEVILKILLDKLPPESIKGDSEPINSAINMVRGKTIEALVNFALRCARIKDKEEGGHKELWTNVLQPMFDAEIARIEKGNDEFVTLFGQYLAQLRYLSEDWLTSNIRKVFASGTRNFRLAVAGLVYAQSTRPLYKLLVDTGILDEGLSLGEERNTGRTRLVERLAVAILWGDEPLEGPRVKVLFEPSRIGDLGVIATFFWQARREQLEEQQIELVRQFWRRTTSWAQRGDFGRTMLVTKLLHLLCYFDQFTDADSAMLDWLTAHGGSEDRTWFLAEDFDRLASKNPAAIAKAMKNYIRVSKPFYDYESHLLNATRQLSQAGLKEDAVEIANGLRNLPEFRALYMEIR